MPAKSWTGKYFPDARAHLPIHFANSAFEMADKFTRNTFPKYEKYGENHYKGSH